MVPLITAIGLLVAGFKLVMGVVGIINAVRNATVLWTAAQWLFNAALWANPITWIVVGIIALIAAIVLCIVYWDEIKVAAIAAVDWIVARWNEAVAWLTGIWSAIKTGAVAIWAAVTAWIATKVAEAIAFIQGLAAIPGRVAAWFGQMKDRAIALLTGLASWIATLPGRILGFLSQLGALAGRAAAWFGGMVTSALGKLGQLISWVAGVPGRILSALGNLGSLLVSAGRDVVNGLWRGIQAGWSWLVGAVRNLASTLLSAAKGALGIASPSKLFRDEIGRWIPEGMAIGITANTGGLIRSARELADLAASAATPPSIAPAAMGAGTALSGIRSGAGTSTAPVQVVINVGGSIRSDRELVSLIRDEMDRGGFRGVR
jgi:phage-related protein